MYCHDIPKFLNDKEPEATCFEFCPNYELFGFCNYGYNCCLYSTHETLKSQHAETPERTFPKYLDIFKNFLDIKDGKAIQRRKYIFTLNKYKKFISEFENDLEEIEKIEEFLNPNNPLSDYSDATEKATKSARLLELEAKHSCAAENTKQIGGPGFPEKRKLDFRKKTYLAPLTTVGNLPFRRLCKSYNCDITCGEMALCTSLLKGNQHEWALLRRHADEDLFGVQICAGDGQVFSHSCEAIHNLMGDNIDFIDLNMGCPIDGIVRKCAGSGLMKRTYFCGGVETF